jgi:dGTPase
MVSFHDLIGHLEANGEEDLITLQVVKKARADHDEYFDEGLSPAELNDISMQKFRVYAIGALVESVIDAFVNHQEEILDGTFDADLIKKSTSARLCSMLKKFAFANAFKHRSVLELELRGHKVIHSIMDMLWPAIVSRGDPHTVSRHKSDPFNLYAYGRISENYRRVFEDKANTLPLEYKRAQLLADMLSGMTDGFALDFESELRALRLVN